ncbi:hypothetical protein [Cronobacter malonaticus]|uniref:hypothetical protein n=1 Tax=Cronobacter malonaticus TaxID=413503 RepID=UPI0029CA7168|nr:hypothetical protein [Cronobacter malonaticus]
MSEINYSKIQWLHDAATEFACTGMKMTMSPDEVLQLTTPLLALRERAEPVPVVPEKCGCWYLVSWCYPGGRYGATEIRLDGQWSTGSMRSATKMIADYNDLEQTNVVILSVFPIAAPQSTN